MTDTTIAARQSLGRVLAALDTHIDALQQRASLTQQLLKDDAIKVSMEFNDIAYSSTRKDMVLHTPDTVLMLRVMSWQSRLSELQQQLDALSDLRASYAAELRNAS